MDIKDIKNKALFELIRSTKYSSSTIENDANDAVTGASSDVEIIRNFMSSLKSLQGECEDIMIKLKEIQDPITACVFAKCRRHLDERREPQTCC